MTLPSTIRPTVSSTDVRTIDTADLRDRLGDPRLSVVDVRPLTAYNGWRLGTESRGGHVPGDRKSVV